MKHRSLALAVACAVPAVATSGHFTRGDIDPFACKKQGPCSMSGLAPEGHQGGITGDKCDGTVQQQAAQGVPDGSGIQQAAIADVNSLAAREAQQVGSELNWGVENG